MASFEFTKWRSVKIANVNLRREKHGEEPVRAIDISVSLTVPNTELDTLIHPKLRSRFYYNHARDNKQTTVVGLPEDDHLPDLQFEQLKQPLEWALGMEKARCLFDYGTGKPIDLTDCKIKVVAIELLKNGHVELAWKIQTSEFKDGVLDKLSTKLDQELPLLQLPLGAKCEEPDVKDVPEPKAPPPPKPPRGDAGKVVEFPKPADAAPDTPPPIDAAQQAITNAMQSAAAATKTDEKPAEQPAARGTRPGPANLE